MISYDIANTILGLILISSFVVIFFFTYGSKVEGEIVKKQSINIVNDLMDTADHVLTPEIKKNIVKDIVAPDMTSEDDIVKKSNAILMRKAFSVIGIVFVIGIILVTIMSFVYKFSLKDLIIHNLIILVFIGLTEFVFLTFFAQNYITIDSSYIKLRTLQSVQKYAQNIDQMVWTK